MLVFSMLPFCTGESRRVLSSMVGVAGLCFQLSIATHPMLGHLLCVITACFPAYPGMAFADGVSATC